MSSPAKKWQPHESDLERRDALLQQIAYRERVHVADICGDDRFPRTVRARHMFWSALFLDGYSVSEVAALVGRNHTSVIAGLRRSLGDETYERQIAKRYPSVARTFYPKVADAVLNEMLAEDIAKQEAS